MGEVTVAVEMDGQRVVGRGSSTDVIEASVRAYLHAINKVAAAGGKKTVSELESARRAI
jgi:2-isopropylmalate synthase